MPVSNELSDALRKKLLGIDTTSAIHSKALHADWVFLVESELMFKDFMQSKPLPAAGELEYGPALYLLHQLPEAIVLILQFMGMPVTTIKKIDWNNWLKNVTNGPGVVASDGTLYLETRYAQLDPKWTESVVYYLYHKWDKKADATFGTNGVVTKVSGRDQLTIAIMGDWGSGPYNDNGFSSPSTLVGNAIKNLPLKDQADITLHLGDVYYAGTPDEEKSKLLIADFPVSSLANFTLNSNHEMYDGANGYFKVALNDSVFKTQKGTSYFAITFCDWVIIGLDTAFYDKSAMYMYGALYDEHQINFIKSLNIGETQKVILMTHHTAISADGKELTKPTYDGTPIKKPLFTQVLNALGRAPDYWYYGHTHNGIVYNDKVYTNLPNPADYKCPSGAFPKLRCAGHGALPFGKGTSLHSGDTMNPEISYFAQTPMPNSTPPTPFLTNRVLNGFATITLNATGIKEQFYEVSADHGTTKVWNS